MRLIKISTIRDCCDASTGLVRTKDKFDLYARSYRCIYCGEVWVARGHTDATGASSTELVLYSGD